jgi:HD-like signal output (HDOD) protein
MTSLPISRALGRNKYATFLIRYQPGTGRDLPLVSPVARRLQATPGEIAVSGEALLQAYNTDPFLAAKICGVANSIFFNVDHRQITSISQALERVGVEYAQKLLTCAELPAAAVSEADALEYWAHCLTVAVLSRRIAAFQSMVRVDDEALHLLGLIHDIGFLVEVSYNPKFMPLVVQAVRGSEVDGPNSHAVLGASLSSFWSLPALFQEALRGHHDSGRCKTLEGKALAALLRLADGIAAGGSFEETEELSAMTLLRVSKEQVTSLLPYARQVHEEFLKGHGADRFWTGSPART